VLLRPALALWAVPSALALALGWAGVAWGWFERGPAGLLLLALEGALLNLALLAAFLELRGRLTERGARRRRFEQELSHLRAWAGEEGALRKAGLIRDLNALGATALDLEQAILRGAGLAGSNLKGARLTSADLRGADLQGAVLDGADLFGADLTEANLALASLRGANLRGCILEGAALTKADLTGANLSRAVLVNANLHGANLTDVALERARFAVRDAGRFEQTVHPSVDDWIRARLDPKGYFQAEGGRGDPDRAAAGT
jgi:hypothetical protein